MDEEEMDDEQLYAAAVEEGLDQEEPKSQKKHKGDHRKLRGPLKPKGKKYPAAHVKLGKPVDDAAKDTEDMETPRREHKRSFRAPRAPRESDEKDLKAPREEEDKMPRDNKQYMK